MKKVLAVSGGLDSVVLLHLFSADPEVVVAHLNHGTRPSADADQAFVARLAEKYHLPFYTAKVNLGPNISEALARSARYRFLRKIAAEHQAKIYTAHHADDLIGSIMINLLRGTGWRGLLPLQSPDLERPFLSPHYLRTHHLPSPCFKTDLFTFAAKNRLAFREDPTNLEPTYLRNRLPTLTLRTKFAFLSLYQDQLSLAKSINELLPDFSKSHSFSRDLFKNLDDSVALELLRHLTLAHQISLTRPQLLDFLVAIRSFAPAKSFNLPKNRLVPFTKTTFRLD